MSRSVNLPRRRVQNVGMTTHGAKRNTFVFMSAEPRWPGDPHSRPRPFYSFAGSYNVDSVLLRRRLRSRLFRPDSGRRALVGVARAAGPMGALLARARDLRLLHGSAREHASLERLREQLVRPRADEQLVADERRGSRRDAEGQGQMPHRVDALLVLLGTPGSADRLRVQPAGARDVQQHALLRDVAAHAVIRAEDGVADAAVRLGALVARDLAHDDRPVGVGEDVGQWIEHVHAAVLGLSLI